MEEVVKNCLRYVMKSSKDISMEQMFGGKKLG